MLSHVTAQLALRGRLQTLLVCTSGLTTLAASATGYVRTSGSFLDEGFAAGMEITPSGFPANAVDTIAIVTDLVVTTIGKHAVAAAATGRSLSVLLPSRFKGENETLTPDPRHPYVEEQYSPGPSRRMSTGKSDVIGAFFVAEPMYHPRVFVPQGTGILADGRYADAIALLFRANTMIALASGDQLRVRSDVAPVPGQRLPNVQHTHSMLPVNVALRVYTTSPA